MEDKLTKNNEQAENLDLQAQWQRVRSRLRGSLVRRLSIAGSNSSSAALIRGGLFCWLRPILSGSWIEAHYVARIRSYWQAEDNAIRRVDIDLQPEWTRNGVPETKVNKESVPGPVSQPVRLQKPRRRKRASAGGDAAR